MIDDGFDIQCSTIGEMACIVDCQVLQAEPLKTPAITSHANITAMVKLRAVSYATPLHLKCRDAAGLVAPPPLQRASGTLQRRIHRRAADASVRGVDQRLPSGMTRTEAAKSLKRLAFSADYWRSSTAQQSVGKLERQPVFFFRGRDGAQEGRPCWQDDWQPSNSALVHLGVLGWSPRPTC